MGCLFMVNMFMGQLLVEAGTKPDEDESMKGGGKSKSMVSQCQMLFTRVGQIICAVTR